MAPQKKFNRGSCAGSERGIISQAVTVGPQITGARVVHTGSAFLLLTVTAPTDVCLNRPPIHGEITSPAEKENKIKKISSHSTLACNASKGARLPSAARGQTGTPSPRRLSTSYLPHPASLFLAVISTAATHFLRLVSKQKPDGFTITASLQIREHFHGLDCREKEKNDNKKLRCFPVKSSESIVRPSAFRHNLVQNTFHLIRSICIHNRYPDLWSSNIKKHSSQHLLCCSSAPADKTTV